MKEKSTPKNGESTSNDGLPYISFAIYFIFMILFLMHVNTPPSFFSFLRNTL